MQQLVIYATMRKGRALQVHPARAPLQEVEERPFHTVAEAATLLQVSPSTVWRWIEAGRLTASRVGPRSIRIRREDIAQIIQPARPRAKRVRTASEEKLRFGPPSREELARRQALIKEILELRQKLVISPLTSAELIYKVRDEESRSYGKPRD